MAFALALGANNLQVGRVARGAVLGTLRTLAAGVLDAAAASGAEALKAVREALRGELGKG